MQLSFKSSIYRCTSWDGRALLCRSQRAAGQSLVSWLLTLILRATTSTPQVDETVAGDYVYLSAWARKNRA